MILAALTSTLLLTGQEGRTEVGLSRCCPYWDARRGIYLCHGKNPQQWWRTVVNVIDSCCGKKPFLRLGGHTHLYWLHCSHTLFPRAFVMSITLKWATQAEIMLPPIVFCVSFHTLSVQHKLAVVFL